MANMNKQLKLPQIQKIMMEFEKQVLNNNFFYCASRKHMNSEVQTLKGALSRSVFFSDNFEIEGYNNTFLSSCTE